MLCSPPPATTLASSCAGSEGFCAPCCRRSSQRSRIHNRPKTGRTLLLHERLDFSIFQPNRPRLWKNASYEVDDGDAFLGADGGGVGRPTGACGLSEAIRF